MVSFDPELIFESKILPGWRAVCERMTAPKRAEYEIAIAGHRERIAELFREYADNIVDPGEIRTAECPCGKSEACEKCHGKGEIDTVVKPGDSQIERDQKMVRQRSISERLGAEKDKAKPAYVLRCIVRVEDLEIQGKPATPELLIEKMPAPIIDEIYEFLERNWAFGLTAEARGNLESPGTSAAVEATNPNPSNAAPAESGAST